MIKDIFENYSDYVNKYNYFLIIIKFFDIWKLKSPEDIFEVFD